MDYQQLLLEKRYEEAIAYLDKHPSSFIDLSYVYDQKGRLYHLLGNLQMAINYLRQAYLLDQDEITLEELEKCYLEDEQYEEAFNCLKQMNANDHLDDLASCYMAMERFEEAIECLKQLESDDWVNTNLMICYEMIGEDLLARNYALQISEEEDIVYELIMINERLKDRFEQKRWIEKLIHYNYDLGMYQLGRYENQLENYQEALNCFNQVENEFYELMKAKVYTLIKLNDRKQAYEEAKRIYLLTKQKDDLIELIEIGSIAKVKEFITYLEFYENTFGKDAFILQKKIRYFLDFDLNQGLKIIEDYRLHFLEDEAFLFLENSYLEMQGFSIHDNQKKILALRGCVLNDPVFSFQGTPLPYSNIERIYEFSEGLAYIEGKERGGYINTDGQLVIDFILAKDTTRRMDSYMFHHHKAFIYDDGHYQLIDTAGNILEKEIDEISFTKQDVFYNKGNKSYLDGKEIPYITHDLKENRMVYLDQKYGYLNEKQEVVIPPIYDWADDFHDGYALVKMKNQYGYIDLDGNRIIECKYEDGKKVYHQQVVVKNKKYGVIDLDENVLLAMIYDEIKVDEKYYYVCKNQKWGVYNHEGKQVIDLIYDEILYFWNHVARVKLGEYYGMIDEQGKVVIPIVFDHCTYAKRQMSIVGLGGRFGYMSITGRLLTPIYFTTATLTGSKGCIAVGKNDLFYIIHEENLWQKSKK